MKNIYLDSLQIHDNTSDIGYFVMPNIQGLEKPEIRLPSFVRPNTDGAVVPNQLYGGRLITLEGKVYANDISTYRSRRIALETATGIQRDTSGNLKPITLKFKTMDDISLQVEVYTRQLVFADEYLTHGKFKLDLFAPSLYLVGQTLLSSDIFVFFGGGMEIPMAIPMSMNQSGSSVTELTNSGNVSSYPIYTLFGPLTNPTFTNLTTGKSFTLNYTLSSSSENITIDTIKRTVIYRPTQNGNPTNIRQYFSGDFVTLVPGVNQVKLSNSNYNNQAFCRVVWRDSYSGI